MPAALDVELHPGRVRSVSDLVRDPVRVPRPGVRWVVGDRYASSCGPTPTAASSALTSARWLAISAQMIVSMASPPKATSSAVTLCSWAGSLSTLTSIGSPAKAANVAPADSCGCGPGGTRVPIGGVTGVHALGEEGDLAREPVQRREGAV